MPNIFISYRRSDSRFAAEWIHSLLEAQFGADSVFLDIKGIPYGIDFRKSLVDEVKGCRVLLAVIDKQWLNACDADKIRRLDKPDDLVRIEIQTALELEKPVIPIVLDQAAMPKADDLPAALRELAYQQCLEVSSRETLDQAIKRLVPSLRDIDAMRVSARPAKPPEESPFVDQPFESATGIKFQQIRAGEFEMGAPDWDNLAEDHEKPLHWVEITRPFYMSIFAVTQEQYQQVMKSNPSRYHHHKQLPVEHVSWLNAVRFCNRLSENEDLTPCYQLGDESTVRMCPGNGYRLPTEGEWEYACRAGTVTTWSFGKNASHLDRFAWYDGNSPKSTQPVGETPPNPWGFYDMYGNVLEWCWDWYDEEMYKHAQQTSRGSPVKDPTGPPSGSQRVVRGGSYSSHANDMRSASRLHFPPNVSDYCGFRIVKSGV